MALKKQESKILPSKVEIAGFEKKPQKENGMRKEGIHDLTIQSSVLQVFEKKAAKGKGDEKNIESRNPRSTIQSSFVLVLCQDSWAKLQIEYPLEP